MKNLLTVLVSVAATAVGLLILTTLSGARSPAVPASPPVDPVARGHYLVHQVGMCIDCHSPRDERGNFLADKHLTGSPLAFAPTVPMPWTPAAPRIAGLPAGYTPEETVHFLMTGERPHGLPAPLPPMPPYRFNRDDAGAIVAYLASLPPSAP